MFEKLAACHSDLAIIPGGMKSQLQLLDVCLHKPIKDQLLGYERALAPEDLVKSIRGSWKAFPQAIVAHFCMKRGSPGWCPRQRAPPVVMSVDSDDKYLLD